MMTLAQLEKELADQRKKDPLQAVTVRVSMPRGLWIHVLESMKRQGISMHSLYISNLIREDKARRSREA